MRARSTTNVGFELCEIGSLRRSDVTTFPMYRSAADGDEEGDGAGLAASAGDASARTLAANATVKPSVAKATLEERARYIVRTDLYARRMCEKALAQYPDSRIDAVVLAGFPPYDRQ